MSLKRSLIFHPKTLRNNARELARKQSFSYQKEDVQAIGPLLKEANQELTYAYRVLATTVKQRKEITAAAEWLIDNFYIIQDQIVEVENDFTIDFQLNLPHLISGQNIGMPRVYDIVHTLALNTDNILDMDNVTEYCTAFQDEMTLKISELWAIPLMIRLVLIMQLKKEASRILKRRIIRTAVSDFISEVIEDESSEPGILLQKLVSWVDANSDLGDERLIYVELAQQLKMAGFISTEIQKWFEYHLNIYNDNFENALLEEVQRQSKIQVSIRNAIISMRQVSETEWQEFVERCSIVDRILRKDPLGAFSDMASRTKDLYRSRVEHLGSYSNHSEKEIAEQVLALAQRHSGIKENDTNDIFDDYSVLKSHVGYYLKGEGYPELKRQIGYREPIKERLKQKFKSTSLYYLGTIALSTIILLSLLWWTTDTIGSSVYVSLAFLLVGFFPSLELSISAINRLIVFSIPPTELPRMKIREIIPDSARTMVVMPTLINSAEDVEKQLKKLEISSLANPNPGLQFILLSDFVDAETEWRDNDSEIIDRAREIIGELNTKYSSRYGDKFFLLHRRRQWNPAEDRWMGWERKRGKLEELNDFLCNAERKSPFDIMLGSFTSTIAKTPVRFVLTLDLDTRTPPGSIVKLVQVMSHPLNRAWYDRDKDRITKGYGIIQPRISIAPDSAYQTVFSHTFSGNVGIDPYTTAVSDIYQDMFGEAIFTGKGLYDVKAFHKVLGGRFPENRILSHDLIESNYVRAALSTNIELFDDYPSTYTGYCKRNHRWTRGDWQIAKWIFRKVPSPDGKRRNNLNLLSRWKIFDNLRRSLNPFFLTLFLISGWYLLPGASWIWTIAAFGILAFPIYVNFYTDLFNRPSRAKWKLYFGKIRSNLKIHSQQAISTLAIMPHQAVLHLDAVARSIWRMSVSQKYLLEWTSASQVENQSTNKLFHYFYMMGFSVFLGITLIFFAILFLPNILWIIIPFSILWITSPYFAWYQSAMPVEEDISISAEDQRTLRTYARRTWFYFERLMNEEFFWLPPDNRQEKPSLPAVSRTSPTNIGLGLVSVLSAFEMGYITLDEFLERLEKAFETLLKLDRYRGHFYNWYEIRLGEVLNPRYISTVDSGNLAASLIVIRQAMQTLFNRSYSPESFKDGLRDTIFALQDILIDLKCVSPDFQQECKCFETDLNDMLRELEKNTSSVSAMLNMLNSLEKTAETLADRNIVKYCRSFDDQQIEDLFQWLKTPLNLIKNTKQEILKLEHKGAETIFENSFEDNLKCLEDNSRKSKAYKQLRRWKDKFEYISAVSDKLIMEMDFSFLYLRDKGLFSIGYNTEEAELDSGTYDLLASEARIASIVAIAKGDVPSEHWFHLGRRLTNRNGKEFLLSWGGTTFEYLMPQLFTRSYYNTLLSHTNDCILQWQREYAQKFGRPWGLSESAFNSLNIDMNYQYKAFGVPGLGLKRGLAEDYVVAPYASALSLMVQPIEAMSNLKRLKEIGALGLMGFYDAVDFTPDHLKKEEDFKVVKIYMAHHHGMSMLSLLNTLRDNLIQDYFHSDPRIKACELLLQEHIPRGIPVKDPYPIEVEMEPGEQHRTSVEVDHAGISNLDNTPPRVHMLSNGNMQSHVSHAGTGYIAIEKTMLTGWRADPIEDPLGHFTYIRDCDSQEYWSAHHQPVKRKPDRYDSWFHVGKVQTSRVDDWIETTTEICVSQEDPVELRRITLTNYSDRSRTLEITSYAEVVLNQFEDHKSHPAFSKLFIQTNFLKEHHGLMAWRRPRSAEEQPMWMVHMLASSDIERLDYPLEYETERSAFIGRGRSLQSPRAMDPYRKLNNTVGNVSDPIFSLRRRVVLEPGEKFRLAFSIGYADSKEEAKKLIDKFDNPHAVNRAFELSSAYSLVELDHIGITGNQFQYFQKLSSYMIYGSSRYRASTEICESNRKQQSALWPYGISGDKPIAVFLIRQMGQLKELKKMLKGHLLWKHRGLKTDLIIINEHPPSYADELQNRINKEIEVTRQGHHQAENDIFALRSDRLPEDDLVLIKTVAALVFDGKLPASASLNQEDEISSLADQLQESYRPVNDRNSTGEEYQEVEKSLQFYNGYGGFSEDGNEYCTLIKYDTSSGAPIFPPAPWSNIVSNPNFGFMATESGAGYSWSENSRENKLSEWSNDPVMDPHSEAFYIRAEDEKTFWSVTPNPAPGQNGYKITHGFGYSKYEHKSYGINSELIQFVPVSDSIKLSKLTLRNDDETDRRVSIFGYHKWVLGVDRQDTNAHIIQSKDEEYPVIFAENHYNNEFANCSAFYGPICIDGAEADISYTTDRKEFTGRNRALKNPLALSGTEPLSNSIDSNANSCAAFQLDLVIKAGAEFSCVFILGESRSSERSVKLLDKYSSIDAVDKSYREVNRFWTQKLGMLQVETPDKSLNTMMNGWLGYQNMACRLWARTGFYQAGGAYGFRDQLQDAMAAFYIDPKLTREQILLHASHQFIEGDVQHWWHPPTGRGVRTRITDDRLWLPYVTQFYVESTGDISIFDEEIAYLDARPLEDGEHEAYLQPKRSQTTGSLFEHCLRAIEVSLETGQHGIPLIGGGDWNDGMNGVGDEGKGESVWLGFFIYAIIKPFITYCRQRGDNEQAERFTRTVEKLEKHLNSEGWDGEWYLRAFYDDGTPLGSAQNEECRIDAISQSWSIISGVADKVKGKQALESLEKHLINREENLIRLLTPPFDKTEKNPGYIKGYIPGVRENGGQYTHAATWAIKAMAEYGYGDKAVELIHMINPINHSIDLAQADEYKVEPYAVAADIYGEQPLTGMGGWTWYTGSAGWMYRVALESILGLRMSNNRIKLKPAIASSWGSYRIRWKMQDGKTEYRIKVSNPDKLQTGGLRGTVDGEKVSFEGAAIIPIVHDGRIHKVSLELRSIKQNTQSRKLISRS